MSKTDGNDGAGIESVGRLRVTKQTVLPEHWQVYLRQLGVTYYKSLVAEYDDMLTKFLRQRPWEAERPLPWREAPSRSKMPGCSVANVPMSEAIAAELDKALEEINDRTWRGFENSKITYRVFLYTAVYWWVTYVYPQRR